MIRYEELRVSALVPLGQEVYQSYTPPAGAKVTVIEFVADAAYSKNSVCRLSWKFNEQAEQTLWTIKGASTFDKWITISSEETDNSRKIAISCENGELGAVYMSAYAKLQVET